LTQFTPTQVVSQLWNGVLLLFFDRDIKWIEKRTNTMTQKQFFEMYPHLGEGFDEFEYEVIQNSKLIAA